MKTLKESILSTTNSGKRALYKKIAYEWLDKSAVACPPENIRKSCDVDTDGVLNITDIGYHGLYGIDFSIPMPDMLRFGRIDSSISFFSADSLLSSQMPEYCKHLSIWLKEGDIKDVTLHTGDFCKLYSHTPLKAKNVNIIFDEDKHRDASSNLYNTKVENNVLNISQLTISDASFSEIKADNATVLNISNTDFSERLNKKIKSLIAKNKLDEVNELCINTFKNFNNLIRVILNEHYILLYNIKTKCWTKHHKI